MINKIWSFLIIVGIIISVFTGQINHMGDVIIASTTQAFDVFFKMAILILFWGGIFNIAIESNLIKTLTHYFKRPLKYLFPELDINSDAMNYIASNILANLLGLGAAATPLGLKAFKAMQDLNQKDSPSRSMITFIVINVSSLTFFPTTILSLRQMYHGNTDNITLILMIAMTVISTIIAIILDRILNFFKEKNK